MAIVAGGKIGVVDVAAVVVMLLGNCAESAWLDHIGVGHRGFFLVEFLGLK